MKKYKNSISKSVLVGCAVFITLLSLIMGTLGFMMYYRGMIGKDQRYIQDILQLTLTEIDGDDLEKCIESKEKSEKYERTQKLLDRIKENYQIEYIYIIKPLNRDERDNVMDVMAGITREEAEEDLEYYSVKLGELTGDAYSSTLAGYYLDGMEKNGDPLFFGNKTEFGYEYTGMTAIRNSAGTPVAVLAVDINMDDIIRILYRYTVALIIQIVLLVSVFLFLMYRWLCNRVFIPLKKLEEVAGSFVENSRSAKDPSELQLPQADIHTEDEMESLSDALTAMFEDMKRYMTNLLSVTAEKERIGAELNVATQIQADMLPRIFPAFPGKKEFELYASMNPAKEVGGDFYDFFLVDDDHLCMVIADVSGKGVPAALFMVIAKTLIKNRALMGDSPSEILYNVNNQLCEGNEAMLFVTVWVGILTISTGKGVAANAGHEHPVIKRAGSDYELVEYKHSPAVAAMEGMRFREHEFELHPGDHLFVYTDGVPEATNAQNELFGSGRMLEVLNSRKEENDPQVILLNMKKEIDTFVGDAPQFDDITMLYLNYKGPSAEETEQDQTE